MAAKVVCMAGPVVMGALSVPAIGFLVRFYVALTRDHSRHSAHRVAELVQRVRADEVMECRTWRL